MILIGKIFLSKTFLLLETIVALQLCVKTLIKSERNNILNPSRNQRYHPFVCFLKISQTKIKLIQQPIEEVSHTKIWKNLPNQIRQEPWKTQKAVHTLIDSLLRILRSYGHLSSLSFWINQLQINKGILFLMELFIKQLIFYVLWKGIKNTS